MANYGQVSYGSEGSDVTELQKLLNNNGYNLSVDGDFGSKTQEAVLDYQQKNGLDADGIVGANTWGALTRAQTPAAQATAQTTTPATQQEAPKFEYTPYQPSETVAQAEALLRQQLAQKPGSYQSAWQAQLNDIIQKIQNREKFSYDLNGDALYQQYKDQYTTQGKLAMMDTMGQAAAMTGGYGNSYAQSVGQQAYQGYLQQLNDKVPELYQLALNQYNTEGQAMYDQASLIAGMEDQAYGRYRDTVSDYNAELARLAEEARYQSEQDYGKWADNLNFTYGQYSDDRAYDYQAGRDAVADQQWQAQFDEAKRQYDESVAASKSSSSSSGGSGGGGYDAATAKTQQMLRDAGHDIAVDGIWGPKTQAAYDEYNAGGQPTETDATKAFEGTLHSEREHDAVMRHMWGSYNQYRAYQIEHSDLTDSEKAYLISKYGITESDTNYKNH